MNRNLHLLPLFNFFNDFRPYNAFAVLYFSQISGSFALGMLIFSVTSLCVTIFEVPTGVFSDVIGRKKTVLCGSVASALAIAFYAWGESFFILAIGSVFNALAQSFFSGNNDALLYDTLAQDNQTSRYAEYSGKIGSFFQIGLGAGAFLAAIFAKWPLQYIFWLSVIPQIICIFISIFIKEPSVHTRKISTNIFAHLKTSFSIFIKNQRLRLVNLASVISWGVGEAKFEFQPAFISMLWPPWAVAISRAFNHVFAWISFWFAGFAIKKYSETKVLFASHIAGSVVLIVAFAFPTALSPALVSVTSILFGLITISQSSLMQKEFSDAERATMASVNSLARNLFFTVAAFTLGLFADKIGPAKTLLAAQVILIPVIYIYWRLFGHYKKIIIT